MTRTSLRELAILSATVLGLGACGGPKVLNAVAEKVSPESAAEHEFVAGLGAAKEGAIGLGLLRGLFARDPLLDLLQIDQVAHDASITSGRWQRRGGHWRRFRLSCSGLVGASLSSGPIQIVIHSLRSRNEAGVAKI